MTRSLHGRLHNGRSAAPAMSLTCVPPVVRAPGRTRTYGTRFRNALGVVDRGFYQRLCGPQMQRLVLLMRGSTAFRGTFRGIPQHPWYLSSARPDTCLASVTLSEAGDVGRVRQWGEDDERSCIER